MKLKDFFKPTFRIMPVYKDYELTGWTVSVKYWWLPIWFTAQLHTIKPNERFGWISFSDSFFPTQDEAIQYITLRKNQYK